MDISLPASFRFYRVCTFVFDLLLPFWFYKERSAAPPAPPLRALSRSLARSLSAALTHIPSIPEEPLGGPGQGRGHLRGGQQRAPGPGRVRALGVFKRLFPGGHRL